MFQKPSLWNTLFFQIFFNSVHLKPHCMHRVKYSKTTLIFSVNIHWILRGSGGVSCVIFFVLGCGVGTKDMWLRVGLGFYWGLGYKNGGTFRTKLDTKNWNFIIQKTSFGTWDPAFWVGGLMYYDFFFIKGIHFFLIKIVFSLPIYLC